MRLTKALPILLFLISFTVFADDMPVVEILLQQPSVAVGETVDADIFVRNGTNVGGVDIGIAVDETCLQIVERQNGTYLDTENSFSALSEINEHDTRLAAAITNRTLYVNGDGIFYRVKLKAICEQGVVPLTVTYALISSYADPNAEYIDVVSYDLNKETLSTLNAELTITNSPTQDTPSDILQTTDTESDEDTTVLMLDTHNTPVPDTAIDSDDGDVTLTSTPADDETTATDSETRDTSTVLLFIAGLLCIVVSSVGLSFLVFEGKRKRKTKQQ